MEKTYDPFIQVLNVVLNHDLVKPNTIFNYDSLYGESKAHKVAGIIYLKLKQSQLLSEIDSNLQKRWRFEMARDSSTQMKHMKESASILKQLEQVGIKTIVLKGMVIRNLYENPTLRTMCDLDILVKKSDLNKVHNCLIEKGYTQLDRDDDHHFVYHKKGYLAVEVHWSLTSDHYFMSESKSFEQNLWQRLMTVQVGEATAYSLGYTDLMIHLCQHMAAHSAYTGFGIRQLFDVALVINKWNQYINWQEFMSISEELGIKKFNITILRCCERLFNIHPPIELESMSKSDEVYLTYFLNDILNGGVYGKRDAVKMFANELAFDGKNKKQSRFNRFMSFLFPPIKQLSERYNYAKSCKLFIPFAWGHHLLMGILNPQYSLIDKIKITFLTVGLSKKRENLLKWLELS